jgi:hypothetical protein
MKEWWRKLSRLWMLEIWTSMTGPSKAERASKRAMEVWVSAPALMVQLFRQCLAALGDIGQGGLAVDFRLAASQHIEIGAVEDED